MLKFKCLLSLSWPTVLSLWLYLGTALNYLFNSIKDRKVLAKSDTFGELKTPTNAAMVE